MPTKTRISVTTTRTETTVVEVPVEAIIEDILSKLDKAEEYDIEYNYGKGDPDCYDLVEGFKEGPRVFTGFTLTRVVEN